MQRISAPFETKTLQLKLKNSLHGPALNSSIPAPSVAHPQTCCLLGEKKAHRGHGKVVPPPEDGVQLIEPFTASSEWIKSTRVMIAQMKNQRISPQNITDVSVSRYRDRSLSKASPSSFEKLHQEAR